MTWFRPQCTIVEPDGREWRHAGLQLVTLGPGEPASWHTRGTEQVIVPLAGAAEVTCDGTTLSLHGRPDVFTAATDLCYLPPGAEVSLTSPAGGRFAVASAVAGPGLPPRYRPASEVPVEVRGAGHATRQVNNLADAETFACRRLIVVEVLTPGGNWSSYPPHKHDEHRPDETELEEIYYFEVAGGGVGYQRVYASAPERPIDVLAEVRSGDVVLVPHGWHGPSMAAPGYDLYYLNVMAGPGERAWRFRDDPAHAWIRDTWADQPADPRVPFYGRHA
ncbi:5-deoxy-glucuronate isomerase [Rhizomonospora bruguierae]|uniref:5-deoxy-glucuronate isomerase n=1 Tax=Rhizomonospora bruguierae TaxID=1581705 RepID=UPI001BCE9DF4|nr:5-deoxy-glucuronate isomerase [Micromonospora sp. NBRC 107566]